MSPQPRPNRCLEPLRRAALALALVAATGWSLGCGDSALGAASSSASVDLDAEVATDRTPDDVADPTDAGEPVLDVGEPAPDVTAEDDAPRAERDAKPPEEDIPEPVRCPPEPECDDEDPCTTDAAVGPDEACEWTCQHEPITPCCGNGATEEGEQCDGDCPICDDGDPCTGDVQIGSPETCDVVCEVTPGDPGTDTDGDTLTDCAEATDDLPFTDPAIFNGLMATIGEPPTGTFTSGQCNLFFGNSYGEMLELFDESDQAQPMVGGWDYAAGKTNDYDDPEEYGFEPNWTHSMNGGVYSSFQIWFGGLFYAEQAGTWCFKVDTGSGGFGPGDIAGRKNCCGRVYLDAQPAAGPLAETGYGAGASPQTGCVELTAGPHAIDIAARHYEAYFYAPKLQVRHCFGGADACDPDAALPASLLQVPAGATPPPDMPPDGEPVTGKGACTNADDQAVLDALGDEGLQSKITACGTDCFFGSDKVACVKGCITSDVGLTPDCADCYAQITGCVFDNCVSQCISQGPACESCMADNGCQDDFPACSGLE